MHARFCIGFVLTVGLIPNANQIIPSGDPFAAELFHDRWYGALCMRR